MRTAFAALVCVFVPAVLHAQSDVRPLPQNDITVSTGWIGAQHPRPADTYDEWHGSLFGGINLGRYCRVIRLTRAATPGLASSGAKSADDIVMDSPHVVPALR